MKRLLSILAIIPIILLSACSQAQNPTATLPDGTKINLELAITSEQKQKGLMFRESLDEKSGMLFVQQEPALMSFWMKNTLIPLDIIFIDESNKVINIANAVPCKEDPCEFYKSEKKAKYVLELNSNASKEHNIRPLSEIQFQNLNATGNS